MQARVLNFRAAIFVQVLYYMKLVSQSNTQFDVIFRCRGLALLETYSAAYDQDTLLESLPKFLKIEREVTGDHAYSMYNLSLKEDWKTSKKYYSGRDSQGMNLTLFIYCNKLLVNFFFLYDHNVSVRSYSGCIREV